MSTIEHAVILAAGLGKRMRAQVEGIELDAEQARAAAAGTKAMIKVGRPFLDHVMTELADAGTTRVTLVIGPGHDEMRRYYTELETSRISIDLVVQPEPLGTANAVLAARDAVSDERFVLINSDNFYPAEALRALAATEGAALVGFEPTALTTMGNIPAERVAAFAMLQTDDDGHLRAITEKPDVETAARLAGSPVSMNCWALPRTIFDACDRISPSSRGEYELPDAVRLLVGEGTEFTVVPFRTGVLDLSSLLDIADVAERLADHEVRL